LLLQDASLFIYYIYDLLGLAYLLYVCPC